MKNPARDKFLPMLSPYVDGELTPEERQQLEQHLAHNKESAGQVADFRAADALMRHALELQADEVDWKKFTDDVMARITPDRLPFFDRLKLTLSELFTYQRGPLLAGLAGAAAAVATPEGYGARSVQVKTVSVESNATVKPVVMEDDGDAIIWVVETAASPDGGKKRKDGESSEETLTEPSGKEGDL
jgi:anti-sigma factor RsiW